jgi:hypothetical protein
MTINYVTLEITSQDAGQDSASGSVTIQPTSAVTIAGQAVVSASAFTRALTGGSVSVELVASDNAGTSPAAGFWAYQITLPGGSPQLYLINYANGASQRLDDLVPVVAQTTYGPAGAVPFTGGTLGEYLAPAVVSLTDAATVSVNAALGNDFRLTLGGDRTMGAPSDPADGQDIVLTIIQPSSGGPYTVTWASAYDFGAAGAPVLSTTAGDGDMVGFKYHAANSKWWCTGSATGF